MEHYRFDCHNIVGLDVIHSESLWFDSFDSAVSYAITLTSRYFDILIYRYTESDFPLKVAEIY